MPWSVYDTHNENEVGIKDSSKLQSISPNADSSLHAITWGEIAKWVRSMSGLTKDSKVVGWYKDENFRMKRLIHTKEGKGLEMSLTMSDMFPGIESFDPLTNSILLRIAGWFYDEKGQKTSVASATSQRSGAATGCASWRRYKPLKTCRLRTASGAPAAGGCTALWRAIWSRAAEFP